ncbi:MAG: hypothetical protein ACPGVN_02570, partial [Alphaproteobacteria bacterium]
SRLIHGQYSNCLPSRFLRELPEEHVEPDAQGSRIGMRDYSQTWRGAANSDLNAYAKPTTPGWQRAQRALSAGRISDGSAPKEGKETALNTFDLDERVFHQKFGYGNVINVEDGKISVKFDHSGDKKLMSAFLTRASEVPD